MFGVDGGETCVQLVTSLGLSVRAKDSRGMRTYSYNGAEVISGPFKIFERHVVLLWSECMAEFCN
jgi:hypothetical protein